MKRILIVDDLASNRRILINMLGKDYAIVEASGGAEAKHILAEQHQQISAVLLDISMPEVDGYEVLRSMRANPQMAYTPVIMTTGAEDESARVKALALGANDFVMKPYNAEIIQHCLRNNIALHESATIIRDLQYDKLTGMMLRETFLKRAGEMIRKREPGYYVMAFFDVDRVKVINDQYGTARGDDILRHIADEFIRGFEPHGGICCRITADNFAVMYPKHLLDAQEIAEIRARAARVEGIVAPVIFSIGRYIVDDLSMQPSAMLDRAVIAAESVKGQYDTKIALYNEPMRAHLLHEQEVVMDMESALKERQFEVWYQPQINHSTGAQVGAEALVRWRHPKKGLIPPDHFIPIFEANGFIYALDRFVWEEVCAHLRRWIDEGRDPLPVSVNISRHDVFRPDIVETIAGLTETYGLPADLLRLEITETAFTGSAQHIIDVVGELIARGFTVEIDDFGSGYSSLNTLKDVPAQILKLDMRFLQSGNSDRGGNIVESVVRMAKWLGMSVIAEGVETAEQADYLRSIGCSYMQGYLYARPMPAASYEEYSACTKKEGRLLTLETVENLDNDSFWNPESMDTLIFNSYVGGACIYEFRNAKIELLRANEKYAQVIGSAGMTVEDALKLNWTEHLDEENSKRVIADLQKSIVTGKEVTGEYIFHSLPGCPEETYLRTSMRVIAAAGDRYLVYCTNENITAQRQAEKREREVAEEMRLIMANVNCGICASVLEPDGSFRVIYANDRFYSMYGYTRGQMEDELGSVTGAVHPDDMEQTLQTVRRLLSSRGSAAYEYRCIKRDGSVITVRCTNTVTSFAGVSDTVLLAVVEDVTERHATEQQIRRLSEQLQAIMDNIDLGIIAAVVKGEKAEYVFANDRYYAMLGYTREQFDAEIQSAYQTVALEDRAMVKEETRRLNRDGGSTVLEYHALTRDRRTVYLRSAISMGRLTGVDAPVQLSVLRDITGERLVSRQLQSMMDDMPGGYARLRVYPDGSLKPVYINQGYCRLVGLSSERVMDIHGEDSLAGVHPDDVPAAQAVVARLLETREPMTMRYRLQCGSGEYMWVNIFCRITEDAQGGVYLNSYYTDATGQVKAEEQQKALLDNLPAGASICEIQDGTMRLVYQNRSYWDLVGLGEGEPADTAPLAAIYPDDVPVIRQEFSAAVRDGRDMGCDIRLRHATDGYRPVHLSGRIVPRDTGSYRIYAAFSPISDEAMSIQEMLPIALGAVMGDQSEYVFVKDRSLRYICCSRQVALLAGCESASEMVGKTDADCLDTALAEAFAAEDRRILETGAPILDSIRLLPSMQGEDRYACTSKYPLKDSTGNTVGVYGIGRDITETRSMKTQLELLTDSIPGGIATYEYSGGAIRLIYFNDGFCRLFNTTQERYPMIVKRSVFAGVYEDDLPALKRQIDALIRDGAQADCLYRIRLPEGGHKWINLRASCTERTGQKVRFNAVLLDVTERQDAIELARISEEENKLAVELGGNIMARYQIHDRTLTVTSHVAATYSVPEVICNVPEGPIRLGMIAPESVDAYTGFFESILHGSEAAAATFRQNYAGQWRWMEAKSTTVFSNEGKPVKAVISFRDVTDQIEKETIYKKWQQSMQGRKQETYTLFRCNLNSDAAVAKNEGSLLRFDFDAAGDSVRKRTRAYVEQCVYDDDRDMLIAFLNPDTMLAEYYRGHRTDSVDYRELLGDDSVRWLRLTVDLVEYPNSNDVEAYLMCEDIDKAKRAELRARELAETDTLTGALNRATFVARVEQIIRASRPNIRHALLMLDIDGFKQVNDTFGHLTGDQTLVEIASGIRSVLRRDDLVARLGGDEFLVFLQDIQNENAAAIKAQQLCAISRKAFSLEVQISGSVGIALIPHDGVDFDTLYQRADAALYYVKGSGKDNYIFYSDSMEDQHLRPEADETAADGVRILCKKRRMLIVDDSTLDFALLQNIFMNDFIVEKARDGNTALIRLRHYGSAISVVLLDLMMPGMDGFAVLEKMQQSNELKSIPVLIVSGDESREACLKAVRSGATDFIPKPVDPDILRIRVQSAISRAENEKLRARNGLLEIQNEERIRFSAALDSTHIAFVENDWLKGTFSYYPTISKYLYGRYDGRMLWQILLSDMVADTQTVQAMQQLVQRLAESRDRTSGGIIVRLKTPDKQTHRFRMNVRKLSDVYGLTHKMILTFCDLDLQELPAE